MKPVLSAAEMAAADARAQAETGLEVLVARAGAATSRAALDLLGGAYGRRVVVVAGKGHNGDDGRVAAAHLARRGARVRVVPAGGADPLPPCDLVVDAAYGTGFRGSYVAPRPAAGTRVLAVDIPSGVAADTGEALGEPLAADATVTFAALKPGLLLGAGARLAGAVEVADIGLALGEAREHLVGDEDIGLLPERPPDAHKWRYACYVVAGSPGMLGAAELVCAGALRAGAGMVRLGTPGAPAGGGLLEVVGRDLSVGDWVPAVLEEAGRCRALVVGPGLGRAPETAGALARLVASAPLPVVVDADGLHALGDASQAAAVIGARRTADVVLTPHDAEFARLAGAPPGADRVGAARDLARRTGAVVLLKGGPTVVARPDGTVLLAASGSPRLATAGTGDVLAGVIGALAARGLEVGLAAALAAHVHGRAAGRGEREGLVASDLPPLLARVLSDARGTRRG